MDCKHHDHAEKRSYHVSVTQNVEGNTLPTLEFDFGTHHDLGKLAAFAGEKEHLSGKHAQELVLGLRLLHHVLKKYPENKLFTDFFAQLDDFKRALKANAKGTCGCNKG